MTRVLFILLPAVLLLSGCPSIRESRPLADALRDGVHLERSLPKKIPDRASKVPHSQYVLIRNESAVGLLVPVPFVADVVENAANDHAAAAYEKKYGHVDPYRIVADAMNGSPVLAKGDAGLPLQPFAFLQECVDDRFRVTLVAHLESGETMGRYLIHLPGTFSPGEIADPPAEVLDRLATELRAAAIQLRELVERGARNQLRPSGVRADVGSLHLVGGRAVGLMPPSLLRAKDADLIEEGSDYIIVRIKGDVSLPASTGGLMFGVHRLRKDQLHTFEKRQGAS